VYFWEYMNIINQQLARISHKTESALEIGG
jgi:hypothetical protein